MSSSSNSTPTPTPPPDWLVQLSVESRTSLYYDSLVVVPCALLYAAEMMVPVLAKPGKEFRSPFFHIFAARAFVVNKSAFEGQIILFSNFIILFIWRKYIFF
jgi:hypothetical protein